jgi:hypothetical protein
LIAVQVIDWERLQGRRSGPRTVSLRKTTGGLLSGHGQVQAFLGSDEVIVDVLAQIDLHPVDLPVKYPRLAG